MDSKTFENYQKRMLDAINTPNFQSKDPFTKLSKVLDNLTKYVNAESFTSGGFIQEVERQFKTIDSSDEDATHFKNTLLKCSNKADALRIITELYNMVNPISLQVGSWSAVASIVNEYMAEIEKSIY